MSTALDRFVEALRDHGCKPQRNGSGGYRALCPGHDDHHPSLDITNGDDGRVLLICRSHGCKVELIVEAIGLRMTDLFPNGSTPHGQQIVAKYDYVDEAGELVYQVVRFAPKTFKIRRPDGHGGWTWKLGTARRLLYRLPGFLSPDPEAFIFITEGEKDADRLAGLDMFATTNPMGAGKWRKVDSSPLRDRHAVVLTDNDAKGRKHVQDVAADLHGKAASVRVVEFDGLPKGGDVSDWLDAHDREDLWRLAEATPLWETIEPAAEPEVADSADLHLTDMGNAERFALRHGSEVGYTKGHGWLTWDGHRWRKDDIGEIQRRGKATVRAIYLEAAEADSETRRTQLGDLAKKTEAINRVKAMIELAQSEPGIALRSSDLDKSPWLFNCANGTINLRTGELRQHDPADHITKISPVRYDPDARSDLWDGFLRETTGGDDELAAFLQRTAGYSLSGDTSEEKLFLVHGPEATGKSTFIEAIKATLGDFATTADFATFLRQRNDGPRNDIARLAGSRLVVSIEVEEGRKLAEGLVKSLTGGDTIACRFLYRESFEYLPAFKLWLVANHAPSVNADDGAIWRRIVRIPFERMVPVERRDPTVKLRLRDPAESGPAILAWAVKGFLDWQRDGLRIPTSVTQATADYRSGEDVLGHFIDDRCITHPNVSVEATQLYRVYKGWCDEAGEKPMTQTAFGRRLKDRGFRGDRLRSGRACRLGIGLLASGGQE